MVLLSIRGLLIVTPSSSMTLFCPSWNRMGNLLAIIAKGRSMKLKGKCRPIV
jgi:hypothetical protein